jgi:hypothetical protein
MAAKPSAISAETAPAAAESTSATAPKATSTTTAAASSKGIGRDGHCHHRNQSTDELIHKN